MVKRTSDEKFSQSGNNCKTIGELSFNRGDSLGEGTLGAVFRGKFKGTTDVAIKRIEKRINTNRFEAEIFLCIKKHQNIVRYYCVEEDDDFM